jgi:RNA polymerase II subunit A C-terminal domain phosphatase SSU72
MLDRNRKIKDHPERWHEHRQVFDVVFTCEERCFDSVCVDLLHRGEKLNRPVHVINVDIKDNHEEAAVGGQGILKLADMLTACTDLDSQVMDVIADWQEQHKNLPILYQTSYF